MTRDDDILEVQRTLRRRLFEGSTAIQWRPGRELAAQLLLYLDDPGMCWQITTTWLREVLDADRVDAGFGGFMTSNGRPNDYVVMAEAQRDSKVLPSALGLRFNASNPGLRALWGERSIAIISDVTQERTFPEQLRWTLLSMGTAAKLALPLRDGRIPVGLICADWRTEAPRWESEYCNQLPPFASHAIGPLLKAAAQLSDRVQEDTRSLRAYGGKAIEVDVMNGESATAIDASGAVPSPLLLELTPAELKVAHLAATGLTYKEIAIHLDRSLSTVDHQLRRIRDKLGMRSTARLVHLLSEHFNRRRN